MSVERKARRTLQLDVTNEVRRLRPLPGGVVPSVKGLPVPPALWAAYRLVLVVTPSLYYLVNNAGSIMIFLGGYR